MSDKLNAVGHTQCHGQFLEAASERAIANNCDADLIMQLTNRRYRLKKAIDLFHLGESADEQHIYVTPGIAVWRIEHLAVDAVWKDPDSRRLIAACLQGCADRRAGNCHKVSPPQQQI